MMAYFYLLLGKVIDDDHVRITVSCRKPMFMAFEPQM